jgi:integrase
MSRSIEGSIYRHGDGKRWFARVQYTDADGSRRQKKRICRNHELAKRKLNELRAEIENDAAGRKTFRELDQFYRKTFVHKAKYVNGKKLSGFRQDLAILKHYLDVALEFFGDKFLDQITYSELRDFKQQIADTPTRHNRHRSIADINHHLRQVRRVLNVAIQNGWLSVNPFRRGDPLIIQSHETERNRILSSADETELLAACDPWRKHIKPIIVFAIETAMRRGEIQSLRWSSVDLHGRCVRVESLNSKTLKSRLIPLSARASDVLTKLWENSLKSQSAFVFGNSDFKKAFNNAAADAGLSDIHFHDLRHTAITRMLEKGISPPLVMKISGHTQQKTFLRYVNQSETGILEIARQLDKAAA